MESFFMHQSTTPATDPTKAAAEDDDIPPTTEEMLSIVVPNLARIRFGLWIQYWAPHSMHQHDEMLLAGMIYRDADDASSAILNWLPYYDSDNQWSHKLTNLLTLKKDKVINDAIKAAGGGPEMHALLRLSIALHWLTLIEESVQDGMPFTRTVTKGMYHKIDCAMRAFAGLWADESCQFGYELDSHDRIFQSQNITPINKTFIPGEE